MGTCGQPGYVFQDFVLNRDQFLSLCLTQGIFSWQISFKGYGVGLNVLNRVSKIGQFLS